MIAAALVAAAFVPVGVAVASPGAAARCDRQLTKYNGVDVFALSPNQVLALAKDPSDNSLPQEAAFENSLIRLERVAKASGLPQCSVRLATQ